MEDLRLAWTGQRKVWVGKLVMRATACLLPLLAVGIGIHAVWTRSYQWSPDKDEWTSGGPTHVKDDGVWGMGCG